MTKDLDFRWMTPEDVPALYEFYLANPFDLNWRQVFGKDWLNNVLDDTEQYRFSIWTSDILLGAVTLWPDAPCIWGTTLWLDPEYRRQGIGRRALEHIWTFAVDTIPSLHKLQGTVNEDNMASLALCERFFGPPEAVIPQQVFRHGHWLASVIFARYQR